MCVCVCVGFRVNPKSCEIISVRTSFHLCSGHGGVRGDLGAAGRNWTAAATPLFEGPVISASDGLCWLFLSYKLTTPRLIAVGGLF